MRARLPLVVLAFLLVWPQLLQAKGAPPHPRTGLIVRDSVDLRAHPSTRSHVLASLVQQSQVEILGKQGNWYHVRIWASVRGWVPVATVTFRHPWSTVSTYHAPEVHYHVQTHGPRSIRASGRTSAAVPVELKPGGAVIHYLPASSRVSVSAWQQDVGGHVWYRVAGGWAPGADVLFDAPGSTSGQSTTGPHLGLVSGKGMWLTLGTITGAPSSVLVRAALRTGVTHLYLESAISPLGFHGKESVGPLIEAAHAHHLSVIAWVYPYLYDVASDVDLTTAVAAFRTPSGQRFDGIAADLENNFDLPHVRSYSQLVRAYLGRGYLLVGVTYPPQSSPEYPFAEVAREYNVIAPMDYWHQTKTAFGLDYGHMPYGSAYAYRYATDSVRQIRRVSGRVPIAPIGQTFDDFGRLEMGPHAPSPDEISGFLRGSRDNGAIGVSFFQWMTATNDEWQIIHDFRF